MDYVDLEGKSGEFLLGFTACCILVVLVIYWLRKRSDRTGNEMWDTPIEDMPGYDGGLYNVED